MFVHHHALVRKCYFFMVSSSDNGIWWMPLHSTFWNQVITIWVDITDEIHFNLDEVSFCCFNIVSGVWSVVSRVLEKKCFRLTCKTSVISCEKGHLSFWIRSYAVISILWQAFWLLCHVFGWNKFLVLIHQNTWKVFSLSD